MNENVGIVVGTGIGGQRNIVEALTKEGFSTRSAGSRMWPRDHYVYFNGRYVKSGSPGAIDGNAFGEGGNVLTGDGVLLVSDLAYLKEHILGNLSGEPTYEQIKEAVASEGRKYHPEARIHVVPTGYFHGGKGHSHIDMFSLLLPQRKILLLDTYHGKSAGKAKEYDAIAEMEGLRLIRYDGSLDGVWYPLNSLVLPTNKGETVAVDSKAISLVRLLQGEGIKTISIGMPQVPYPSGKIRCQTNVFDLKDDLEKLLN